MVTKKSKRKHSRSLVFKYVNDVYDGKLIPRPRIEVRVSNGRNNIRLVMLVDSGADTSFIPLEVAEILQLHLGATKTSRSASGPFSTRHGEIKAEIVKGNQLIPLGKLPVNVPVKKTQDHNFLSYALLGRIGLFTQFDVTFREKTKKLILKSPKTGPNSR